MLSARNVVNKDCMQGYTTHENEHCHGGADCATCGWNIKEHSRRIQYIKKVGLTKNADGKYQLIVRANA